MRLVWLLVLVLLTSCCQQGRPAVPDERARIASLERRTVRVFTYCGGKLWASGTGVLLGAGWVVTASHVVPANCASMADGKYLEPKGRDAIHDLAVFHSPHLRAHPIGWSRQYRGQDVTCVGWPMQHYLNGRSALQVTKGHVIVDYGTRLRVSCSFESGSSGGPVFDSRGRLVGIMTEMNRGFNDEYLIAPATAVKNLVDAAVTTRN